MAKDDCIIQRHSEAEKPHSLVLENRERAVITGVSAVDGFNEAEITAVTGSGTVTVFGSGLHVTHLDLAQGELRLEAALWAPNTISRKKSALFLPFCAGYEGFCAPTGVFCTARNIPPAFAPGILKRFFSRS